MKQNNKIDEMLICLNQQQREAVLQTQGPCLILAGAGTGKTRTLMTRIAYIVLNSLAPLDNILAVTFTNKASTAMKLKLSELLNGPDNDLDYGFNNFFGLWLGTFHSICARILRLHTQEIGLPRGFTILNQDDQLRLIKQILKDLNIDTENQPPKIFLKTIEKWKNQAILPNDLGSTNHRIKNFDLHLQVYKTYEERLHELGAIDFSSLILCCIDLMRNNPEIRAYYKEKFKYVMVDEYQDINVAQYLFLRTLCDDNSNICCVGDEDQSIYSWRGAEVNNILSFQKLFKNAKITRLEQNYRSTANIINAASALISNNGNRLGKNLWVAKNEGSKVKAKRLYSCFEEADFIATSIAELADFKSCAILVRTSQISRKIEEHLMQMGIPYKVLGGQKFYDRLEILDSIAYCRLCFNPNDSLAFERIINTPKRSIGATTLAAIQEIALQEKIPLIDALEKAIEMKIVKMQKAKNNIKELIDLIKHHHKQINEISPGDILCSILEQTGYTSMWKENKEDGKNRLDNIDELLSSMRRFESMEEFLNYVGLVHEKEDKELGSEKGSVSLMTLHGAKGLEFDNVFLPAWEAGILPNARALNEYGDDEEERRLAYVGITRACNNVYITYVTRRFLHGHWQYQSPSHFIKEACPVN